MSIDRRGFLATGAASLALASTARAAEPGALRFIATREGAVWQDLSPSIRLDAGQPADVRVSLNQPAQTIEAFGACFNELGHDALALLPEAAREAVLKDLFGADRAQGRSMGFTRCRLPVGANDFSRDWYSYNETAGDFAMQQFSIRRDEQALIPFIKAAKRYQPALSLWASPWSPPTWMKTNGHYAQNVSSPNQPPNGLRPDQVVREGSDGFIQSEPYYRAYALYFRRFIEEYAKRGIPIGMVMPQNEFNSNQSFPSCVWTPEGLARFIPHLHEALSPLGVALFFGTLERPDTALFERVYADPAAKAAISGIGLQWAGRGAAPFLGRAHPELKLYQTEQECGDGRNDWRYARYTWDLIRDYMEAGVSVYQYWNMALIKDRPSTWGWSQNSLVLVDAQTRTHSFTPDYYTLKHVCHFVEPGARRVKAESWSGHDNALAFVNPDGGQVLVFQNDQSHPLPLRIGMAGTTVLVTVPPNALCTVAS